MNPYEVLGLQPGEVTPAAVEARHKALRSSAHPDRNGGDASKMTQINTARDILLNPDRRRRFDETGSTESGSATIEEQAIIILGNLFQIAIDKAPDDMPVSKMLLIVAKEVANGQQKAKECQALHPRRIKRIKKIMKSFDCDPLLRKALESRLAKMEREVAEINQQIELGNLMTRLLQSVRFK